MAFISLQSYIYFPHEEAPRDKKISLHASLDSLFQSAPRGTYILSNYTPLEEAYVPYALN